MVFIVSARNEEASIKNKDARMLTTENMKFLNTQGQLTLQSMSNLVEIRTYPRYYGCPYYYQE